MYSMVAEHWPVRHRNARYYDDMKHHAGHWQSVRFKTAHARPLRMQKLFQLAEKPQILRSLREFALRTTVLCAQTEI